MTKPFDRTCPDENESDFKDNSRLIAPETEAPEPETPPPHLLLKITLNVQEFVSTGTLQKTWVFYFYFIASHRTRSCHP